MIEKFWTAHARSKKPDYYSDNFKDLLTKMLRPDPEMRPSAEAIFKHPWFNQDDIATPEVVHEEMK